MYLRRAYRKLRLPEARLFVDRQRLLRSGGIVENAAGVRIHVNPDDARGAYILRGHGVADREAAELWALTIEAFNPTVLADVGANYGEVGFSVRPPDGSSLHLFEPNPRVIPFLQETVTHLDSTWPAPTLHRVGASDASGAAALRIGDHSGLSSIEEPNDTRASYESIELIRLDEALPLEEGDRLLLKLDVEGHEMAAISGLDNAKCSKAIVCEVEHLSSEELGVLSPNWAPFLLQGGRLASCEFEALDRHLWEQRTRVANGMPWSGARSILFREL